MTWEGWPRDRLERRLKTEQTTLENIERELERWNDRKYQQTKVVVEIEQALKREETDGTR